MAGGLVDLSLSELLTVAGVRLKTTLARIESHRIRALIMEDLQWHPSAAFGEIHERIGREIPDHQVRRLLKVLVAEGIVKYEGEKRWRRYWVV